MVAAIVILAAMGALCAWFLPLNVVLLCAAALAALTAWVNSRRNWRLFERSKRHFLLALLFGVVGNLVPFLVAAFSVRAALG